MTMYITDAEFKKEVLECKILVLVDFYADWCGPCKMMAPAFDEVSKEYIGKVKFAKINVEENPIRAGEFGVMSIPCLILYKEGKEIERMVGAMTKAALKGWIGKYVK